MFLFTGLPQSLHFLHVSGFSVSPVVGVQNRALAVLVAATWNSRRGAAGGAEARGSRVASILESLPPGSELQRWFQALEGNQVMENPMLRTPRRARETGWNWRKRPEKEGGKASAAGLEDEATAGQGLVSPGLAR